jgi:hypothetical protein
MELTAIPITKLKEIELFDIVIIHHGFEEYKRDYYFLIESGTKEFQGRFKIRFTHCFDLQYRHKFANMEYPELLRNSWEDDLILSTIPSNETVYWWGQGFTHAYPGFSYEPENSKAKELSAITGRPMYAVNLETEHYEISFVFHDFNYIYLNSDMSISDKTFIPVDDFKF